MAKGPSMAHLVNQEALVSFTKGQFHCLLSPLERLAFCCSTCEDMRGGA